MEQQQFLRRAGIFGIMSSMQPTRFLKLPGVGPCSSADKTIKGSHLCIRDPLKKQQERKPPAVFLLELTDGQISARCEQKTFSSVREVLPPGVASLHRIQQSWFHLIC